MKNKILFSLLVVAGLLVSTPGSASAPGLPFTEDFSDTSLRDADGTTANWSTVEQALILNWRETRYGAFAPGLSGTSTSSDAHDTYSIALGDVDGDGDLDLVAGNYAQANRLYLNNSSANPFSGVSGSDISSDAHDTYSIALGDVDGDGDLDLVAGNYGQTNRL
ncbi:MAG: VCBS repeat-containing protein, partial [Anaerolineaceae bacterium]|nr:VCBS repeat-containing protein [Anaerolineaceae bacterium]